MSLSLTTASRRRVDSRANGDGGSRRWVLPSLLDADDDPCHSPIGEGRQTLCELVERPALIGSTEVNKPAHNRPGKRWTA